MDYSLMNMSLPRRDCVVIVIARSTTTKQSMAVIEKEKIATPPSVSRDDKTMVDLIQFNI